MKDSKELRELEQLCEAMTEEVCKIRDKIEEFKNKKEKLVANSWGEAIKGKDCFWIDIDSGIRNTNDALAEKRNYNCIPTEELAEAFLAKMQLATIMYDAWGEWRPCWTDCTTKRIVCFAGINIRMSNSVNVQYFLAFPAKEMAEEFVDKHRDLIMKARLAL